MKFAPKPKPKPVELFLRDRRGPLTFGTRFIVFDGKVFGTKRCAKHVLKECHSYTLSNTRPQRRKDPIARLRQEALLQSLDAIFDGYVDTGPLPGSFPLPTSHEPGTESRQGGGLQHSSGTGSDTTPI